MRMQNSEKIECVRCVMDISDPEIEFDSGGNCSHCRKAEALLAKNRDNYLSSHLEETFDSIKTRNIKNKHDGIIGLSGGLDSAYVLTLAVEHGLRPLVVHVDAGWNSDISSSNIRALVEHYDLRLKTIVINWDEMRRLQIAYLKSGLMNQDVPQDHAFFASLYRFSAQQQLNDVITGENVTTESILPRAWEYGAMDGRQVRAIARKFDGGSFSSFPFLTIPRLYVADFLLRRLQVHKPLTQVDYSKGEAQKKLNELIAWKHYEGKHGESSFTSFYQSVYLPRRFGIDKRRAYLSSLIVSGQVTRSDALQELAKKPVTETEERNMIAYVARKLDISVDELESYMHMEAVSHRKFPNHEYLLQLANSDFSKVFRRIVRS